MTQLQLEPEVYQGQFGEFRITDSDRTGVIIYRTSLMVAALSFAIGSFLVIYFGNDRSVLNALTPLYVVFCLALGISLLTIHIYMAALHRVLQIFWGIGAVSAAFFAIKSDEPLALFVYNHPLTLFGIGFTFAALTGIFFKEGFCFNRLETKLLTPLVPMLLLGKMAGVLPLQAEQFLLGGWAILFMVFALRKTVQRIPDDIGDKSVFSYLKQQKSAKA
ncbi:Protein of unknown function DUF2301, transmembrane [Crinalium epipsammum PCC 9333]|uniref:Integral membrane protein n=1 Tax=Crinalium epipsammum PCC 9333 TaxID=1173022 RepID=K9VX71_9CYAN|nr:DUF2301 domain-containing membrane protein [Crinalium epipsammum]AFZ12149.1 Protein of unknown function DUF2301, transmembrane [Crinalium epipsammum PCC 9333]